MGKFLLLYMYITVFFSSLHAYESENKLEVVIIGKVAKFITWKEKNNTENFVITVLNNPYGSLFDETFSQKQIKNKNIVLKYIDNIDELQDTNILYIPVSKANELEDILRKVKSKNILTISSIRGFAEKQGIMQIYFVLQKVKLKINLDIAKSDDLQINASLLSIADVIKGNSQ